MLEDIYYDGEESLLNTQTYHNVGRSHAVGCWIHQLVGLHLHLLILKHIITHKIMQVQILKLRKQEVLESDQWQVLFRGHHSGQMTLL